MITKPGKDDYHECGAYRTVLIMSCEGKRFEHITLRRLISVFEDQCFDTLQFAYMQCCCHDRFLGLENPRSRPGPSGLEIETETWTK